MHTVKILPDDIEIKVKDNTDLLSAITDAGIYINSDCGGNGTCGKCKVIIKNGYVLSFQTNVTDDLVIEIPYSSRIEEIHALIDTAEQTQESVFAYQPLAKKVHLKLVQPSLENNIPDYERLKSKLEEKLSISNLKIGLSLLKALPHFLRKVEWDFTASLVESDGGYEFVQFEPGDRSKDIYGIALDIGTTTVVAYLVNLDSGKVHCAEATYNQQISLGQDVITRIMYSTEKKGLKKLSQMICNTINDLIAALVEKSGISQNDILAVQSAGNTTMIHLFLGINPEYIRKEPYIPVVNFPPVINAEELNIKINPRGTISCLPGVASYLGGDITAGVLASGMDRVEKASLLVDLGTNGEIVLGNSDWLVGCSCSAGPAFEGVGIKCGISAIDGAIQSIKIDNGEVTVSTINNKKPKGICGSGLIDIPAELLRNSIIDRSGKFRKESVKSNRLRKNEDDEYEFVIVSDKDSHIVITESDIATLLRSKGAVFLGMQVLLQEMKLKFEDIDRIYISGGFGTALDIGKAILIGLLPDLPDEKFSFIGNSSVAGAKICLLSKSAREKAKEIVGKMTYIDLSTNPKFMNEYTSTLFLPHTDIELFPTVKRKLGI